MANNNNVQNVRFLRNGTLFESREAARAALDGMQSSLTVAEDGSVILARYGSGSDIKTLAGFIYATASVKTITIFDIEDAGSDVTQKINELRTEINNKLGTGVTSANTATAQLAALSGTTADTSATTSVAGAKKYADDLISTLDVTDTAVTGEYVSQVSEADGKISVSRVALPDASSVYDDNKVVTDVTQSKGAITATASNITGVKLAGYAEASAVADIATTDTLGQALGKLQKTIHEMDKDASVVAGQVVTTVSEADGVVSETKANVKDLQLGGYSKTSDTGAIASADTINVALSKLENKVAANAISNDDHSIVVTPQSGDDTDIKVNIKSGEEVILLGNDGIYTDLDLVKITTGLPETIKERYQFLASNDSQIGENIDIPKDSHIVSINYITTGEHAQNLEYVYIDASGATQTTYVDMSELVLEAEFASGVTVTDHVAHGVVDSTSEKDESNNPFLTVGADGFKVSGIKDAIDTKINKLDADLSGNTTHVTVGVEQVDGKITAVTVAEDDIASKSDLDALSAKTVTEIASSNASISATSSSTANGTVKYDVVTDASKVKMSGFTADASGFTAITEASTVTEAVKAMETAIIENEEIVSASLNELDGRLDVIESGYVETVKVNNVALPETNNAVNVQISGVAGTDASESAIVVNTNNSTGAVTLQINYIDAGTY